MTPCGEAAYVTTLMLLYIRLPETPLRPGPHDRSAAASLYRQGVSLSLAEAGLLLASLRRAMRDPHLPPLAPIRSLAYFQPVIAELQQQPWTEEYLDYLRSKFKRVTTPSQKPAPCL
jgi:hypothetical protein